MKKRYIRIACIALSVIACIIPVMTSSAQIAWGSTGSDVSKVQQKLKQWGYYDGSIDGIFGRQTYDAVVWFQKSNGLTADGKVGTQTAQALGITLSSSSKSSTSAEEYLLARAIYAEARGEPYTGQVAVGAVILNRVRSAQFPNTIAGVIYQNGAFTCVSDGQINLTPDETAMRAARDAMNGWDPTGGCLYYYNPRTAVAAWIFSRTVVTVIGNHRFAV